MANLYFNFGFLPYVNDLSDVAVDINEENTTGGLGGSWYVEKFVPNQDLIVNRAAFILGNVNGALNPSYFVGITTSLGPHGMFPYTSDGIAGSAGSLGFISASITSRFTASEFYFPVALPSNVNLLKGEPYWTALQVISRVSGGTFQFFTKDEQTIGRRGQQMMLQNSTGAVTILDRSGLVVLGYDSGSGNTIWYSRSPYVGEDQYFPYHSQPYYEFGAKFEINDFKVQELFLDAVTFGNIYPVDSNTKFTCRLYDQQDSVVGIAITEQAFYPSGGAVTNRGNFIWYFVPPVRILPDYEYKIGIVATGNTAVGEHRRYIRTGGNEFNNGSLTTYCDFVERFSSNSSFGTSTTSDGEIHKANIFLNLRSSNKMRRGQGN